MSDSGHRNLRIRPTVDTRFHIDYAWWDDQKAELRRYLISLLPQDKQAAYQHLDETATIDYIDPETAQVRQVDPLQMGIQNVMEDVDLQQTPLVDAVFRVFLANGNSPLSPLELEEKIGRPARTILRTLAGARVYRGLRPVIEE